MTSAAWRIFGDAVDAQIKKTPTSQRDRLASHTDGRGDLLVLKPIAGQQDHPGTLRETNAGALALTAC